MYGGQPPRLLRPIFPLLHWIDDRGRRCGREIFARWTCSDLAHTLALSHTSPMATTVPNSIVPVPNFLVSIAIPVSIPIPSPRWEKVSHIRDVGDLEKPHRVAHD